MMKDWVMVVQVKQTVQSSERLEIYKHDLAIVWDREKEEENKSRFTP